MTTFNEDVIINGNLDVSDDITVGDGSLVGAGEYSPRIKFDDTNNFIALMGAKVGVSTETPGAAIHTLGMLEDGNGVIIENLYNAPDAPAFLRLRARRGGASAGQIGDALGQIEFVGNNTVGASVLYARVVGEIANPAVDASVGCVKFYVNNNVGVEELAAMVHGGNPNYGACLEVPDGALLKAHRSEIDWLDGDVASLSNCNAGARLRIRADEENDQCFVNFMGDVLTADPEDGTIVLESDITGTTRANWVKVSLSISTDGGYPAIAVDRWIPTYTLAFE